MDIAGITHRSVLHLNNLQSAVNRKRQISTAEINSLYLELTNQEQDTITVSAAACLLFKSDKATTSELLATSLELQSKNVLFEPIFPHVSQKYRIRPVDERDRLLELTNPLSPGLAEFLTKARKLIIDKRSGIITPTCFSDYDQTIIDLVKKSLSAPQCFSTIEHVIALDVIIRRLSPLYRFKPNDEDVILFLKEIGVFAASENLGLYARSSKGRVKYIPGQSEVADALVDCSNNSAASLLSIVPPANVSHRLKSFFRANCLDLAEYRVAQSTSRTRKDFGSTPAFVIDDIDAHELDDGISLDESSDGDWIRIHIADPTHLISPNNDISKVAQLFGNSIYLPEKHFPMLPGSLTASLDLRTCQRALTFSARLDESGEISDYDITLSVIPNRIITRYEDVDQLFATKSSTTALDATHIRILSKLRKLADKHRIHRVRNGAMFPEFPSVSISTTPAPPTLYSNRMSLTHDNQTVDIKLCSVGQASIARNLVAECMIIAGRVAAKFSQERRIPVAYRGQPSIEEYLENSPVDIRSQGSSLNQIALGQRTVDGTLSFVDFYPLLPYLPKANYRMEPGRHSFMGISQSGAFAGYTKVTSPLRRYQDLIAHWQIKASLHNASAISSESIGRVLPRLEEIEAQSKQLQKNSERFWTLEWVRRQEILNSASPVGLTSNKNVMIFDAIVIDTSWGAGTTIRVMIPKLGTMAACVFHPQSRVKFGDTIKVTVEKVNPNLGQLLMSQFI